MTIYNVAWNEYQPTLTSSRPEAGIFAWNSTVQTNYNAIAGDSKYPVQAGGVYDITYRMRITGGNGGTKQMIAGLTLFVSSTYQGEVESAPQAITNSFSEYTFRITVPSNFPYDNFQATLKAFGGANTDEFYEVSDVVEFVRIINSSEILDNFTGTNGSAWNSSIWETTGSGGHTVNIQNNRGRIVTGTSPYSSKAAARSQNSYGRGRVHFDCTIPAETPDYKFSVNAWGQGNAFANYLYYPRDGYFVEIAPQTGATALIKSVAENLTTLATLAGTSGATYSDGDTIRIDIENRESGVVAWVWKNAEARPTNPNLVSTDTSYVTGRFGMGAQTGGSGVATVDFDNVEFFSSMVASVNAGSDQTVASNSVVTLTGTPAGGVWTQDSGAAVTLSAPVTTATDTKVTFVSTNASTTVNDTRVFRYTHNDTSASVDTFTRTASTSVIGSHPTAGAYTAVQGTWGITADGKAYCSSGVDNDRLTVDSGTINWDISARITIVPDGYWGLMAGYNSADNAWRVEVTPSGSLSVVRRVAGAQTQPFNTANGVIVTGDVIGMKRTGGNVVTIYQNGIQLWQSPVDPVLAFSLVGFKYGTAAGNVALRWDDFKVTNAV